MTADITIVGLGPGPAELRTVAVQRVLELATRILVRDHPGADYSDLLGDSRVTDVLQYRDPAAPSGQRWAASAAAVVETAANEPVVLAIPGHPRFGEMLVEETIALAQTRNMSVEILDGVSVIELLAAALNLDPIRDRVQLVDAREIERIQTESPFAGGSLLLTPALPVLITHVYTGEILSAVSAQLQRILPADHPVNVIDNAGLPDQSILTASITTIADHPGGPMMALYVPGLELLEAHRSAATLHHIMARLRRPDGCPWDRKQTNATLRDALVDEVYEAVDAINSDDDANLAEELGDVLMLIMMHAQIAEERGAFTLEDVYDAITTKIVRRHPHVFGDEAAEQADEVVGLWQRIKQQEKATHPAKPEKAADGQPHAMPALERARRVLAKHPLESEPANAVERQRALLQAVANVVAAGDDPEDILKTALVAHVTATPDGAVKEN